MFKPRQRPIPANNEDEILAVHEDDIESVNKEVVSMNHRKNRPDNDDRMKRFMGQYMDTKGKSNYSQAGGRMTATGIVVDNINEKFKSGNPEHLMQLKPPATSTPTAEELADAWGGIEQREQAEDEFFSDPVVQFIMMVDGFSDNNNISKSTTQTGQGIPLSDAYKVLADYRVSNYQLQMRPPTTHGFNLTTGNAGLTNVAGRGQVDNTFRVYRPGNLSVSDEVTQTVRRNNLQSRVDIIRSNVLKTPAFSPIRRISYDTPSSSGGIPDIDINTPRRPPRSSFGAMARHSSPYYEPSGPSLGGGNGGGGVPPPQPPNLPPAGVPPPQIPNLPAPSAPPASPPTGATGLLQNVHIPSSILDTAQVQDTVNQQEQRRRRREIALEGVDEDEEGEENNGSEPKRSRRSTVTIADLASDPDNRAAIAKYLSDLRTANAYNYMNRPEVTGRITILPNTLSAIKMAHRQLITKFGRNYQGSTLMDFIVDENINTYFAYYVSLWRLYNISKAMNKITLERTQPRLLSERVSLENSIFSRFKWNAYTGTFEDTTPTAPPSYTQFTSNASNTFQRLYATQNEMFNY